jgi:hypothetical protein
LTNDFTVPSSDHAALLYRPVSPSAAATPQRHLSGKLKVQNAKASDRITQYKTEKKPYKPTLQVIRE